MILRQVMCMVLIAHSVNNSLFCHPSRTALPLMHTCKFYLDVILDFCSILSENNSNDYILFTSRIVPKSV